MPDPYLFIESFLKRILAFGLRIRMKISDKRFVLEI